MKALEGITPLVRHQIGINIHLAMYRWLACRIKLTRCKKLITGTLIILIECNNGAIYILNRIYLIRYLSAYFVKFNGINSHVTVISVI